MAVEVHVEVVVDLAIYQFVVEGAGSGAERREGAEVALVADHVAVLV